MADMALAVLCLALFLAASAKPAYAYADPGSGLMAIQILGSTLAGFLFLARRRVIDLFVRIREKFSKKRR